ncbi:MAG: ATP-binding protein [Bacteroidetes bacterium]|nr:ATP-binding protein [Bacteroidota bacterium]
MKIPTHSFERYYIPLALLIIALLLFSYILDYKNNRSMLYELLTEEAFFIAEAMNQSGENILLATEAFEYELQERLSNNARYLAYLDSQGEITEEVLRRFAQINNLARIRIFRTPSRVEYDTDSLARKEVLDALKAILAPVFNRTIERETIHPRVYDNDTILHYAVAIARQSPRQGIILVEVHSSLFGELRKTFGIGKLLRDIIRSKDVVYVAIQDSIGLLAASGAIEGLTTFTSDSLLTFVMESNKTEVRTLKYTNSTVYEVIRPFTVYGETFGVIRIGLSLNKLHDLEKRMFYRSMVLSLIFVTILFLAIEANRRVLRNYQRIERMERYTHTLLEHMQDAVLTIDRDGIVVFFNRQAEKLFGIRGDDVVGKHYTTGLTNYTYIIDKLLSLDYLQEITTQFPDGKDRTLSIAVTRTDHTITAVVRDRTEVKKLEYELHRKEKFSAMGELASAVAHEIRNPLNAVSLLIQRLATEFTPKKGAQTYRSLLEVLNKELHRLNGIVHQFLTFARVPKPHMSPVNVKEFLTHLSTLLIPLAQQRGVQCSVKCTYEGYAHFDAEQITQVVLNLFQNALDATPPGGSILLSAAIENSKLLLSVKDTGIGISKDMLGKIFDLYVTTKPSGTGMGLPLAQQIVFHHNGTIEVTSTEGKGSTFTVVIPLHMS